MPFQSAPNCASVAIRGTYQGANVANVLNFHCLHTYDLSDLQALADAIDGVVGSLYLIRCPDQLTYVETHVRGLTNIVDLEATSVVSAGPGTAGAAGLPGNQSFVITLRTGNTGRSARGRFYTWPTVQGSLDTPQTVYPAHAAFMVGMVQQFQIDAGLFAWELVILSRFSAGVARPTATFIAVNDVEARNLELDSMRSRLLPNH